MASRLTAYPACQIVIPVLRRLIDLTPVVSKFFVTGIAVYENKIDPKNKNWT